MKNLSRGAAKRTTAALLAIAMSGFAQEADEVVSDDSFLKKDTKTSEYSENYPKICLYPHR